MPTSAGERLVPMVAGADAACASLLVDRGAHRLEFELGPEQAPGPGVEVAICGFAPEGWEAAPLFAVETATGVWEYGDAQEENVLAGLAYLRLDSAQRATRRWMTPRQPEAATFPTRPVRSCLMGTCARSIEMVGLDALSVDLQPAIVDILRSPTGRLSAAATPLVRLEFTARCDGGCIAGVGPVDVEVRPLEGTVESLQTTSDFPARMTMSLRMQYKTGLGTFITDVETFVADRIDVFPPFGVELVPVQPRIRLLEANSGRHVGYELLGPLVPLCHLLDARLPARIPTRLPLPTA